MYRRRGVAWQLSRRERAVTYQLEMSGMAGRWNAMPSGGRRGGWQGGSGNISSLELRWETLAFIGNNEELKQFVRMCLNMLSLQHVGLRPVSRTVTLWKALFYRFLVRPYPPHCLSHARYSESELVRSGACTWLEDMANVRSGRLCTDLCRSRKNTALTACLVYWESAGQ
jgi:hypothetical protein